MTWGKSAPGNQDYQLSRSLDSSPAPRTWYGPPSPPPPPDRPSNPPPRITSVQARCRRFVGIQPFFFTRDPPTPHPPHHPPGNENWRQPHHPIPLHDLKPQNLPPPAPPTALAFPTSPPPVSGATPPPPPPPPPTISARSTFGPKSSHKSFWEDSHLHPGPPPSTPAPTTDLERAAAGSLSTPPTPSPTHLVPARAPSRLFPYPGKSLACGVTDANTPPRVGAVPPVTAAMDINSYTTNLTACTSSVPFM